MKAVLISIFVPFALCAAESSSIVSIQEIRAEGNDTAHYVGNRKPLLSSPLIKLPIGAIEPHGWLRHQLELEARGMTGRLPEVSKWCKFEGNAWASAKGEGHSGWEELPYWLKGYGDLGYVLKDEQIIREARQWIDAVLASQEESGWFGPRSLKTSLKGKPDLWPHMVMLNVLQSFYEYTGDVRVLPFMTKYHKWLNEQPPDTFGNGYWPKIRFGDNIETAYWLYNRTGDRFLLDLTKRIHENMANWASDVINWHNVNIAQGFREPGVFYAQAGDGKFLEAAERNYRKVKEMYGQFPGGGFAGDENCRPGFQDPRQGFETCGIVEFMHSFEMLTRISGQPLWSDRCEEISFNSFPAALTPDWKGLHYLTSANVVQLDRGNKAPGVENSGAMFSYSPFEVYRCCQHNVSHGWPYFAEELWLATYDRGLCASLYSACSVSAKVGSGTEVKIREETDYPFSETIRLKLSTPSAVSFPLYLRIPGWCKEAGVKINNRAVSLKTRALSYAVLNREWKDGDTVELNLPMRVTVHEWPKNQNSISVDYGPLTFALKIGERWVRYGDNEAWPEWEVYPTTPWNYGLVLEQGDAAKSFEVSKRSGRLAENPFTPETAPFAIRANGKRIPQWTVDKLGLLNKLQVSPVKSEEPLEKVTLIPMGAARLRIASFPLIGDSTSAREWTMPKPPPISASHCFQNDSVEAMIDGQEPKSSSDASIPRFTWWDHRGTTEWVQYDFGKPRRIAEVAVYWFDDSPRGGCRAPQSWKLFYKERNEWRPVQANFTTDLNRYNRASFAPIETTALRIEAKLRSNFSGGILEWKVR
jgi:DUF1680 family protein